MINKDWKLIYDSLNNNWVIEYLWKCEIINKVSKFDTFEHTHLWPDLIWVSEKKIYWIEHFYVDASIKNKKWTKLKVEKFREIEKKIMPNLEKDLETKKISTYNHKFKSILTYENLKSNIYSNFDEHYKKIDDYNKNIKEKYENNKNIEIIFFIEFDTLVSAYLENWNFIRYIHPFNDINFLNYFSDKKAIKWIIFSINKWNIYIPIEENYKIDNENIFDFTNWTIEDFEMNQTTTWMKI